MKNDIQKAFLKKYREEKPMFQAWGNYVQKYIYEQLESTYGETSKIIKIKCDPRVKDEDSIIAKAFFRKNYDNAYEEITDKVGIRFVVMVTKQIEIIKSIVEESDLWDYSKDQDYEEAIKKHPDLFSYQSVHYIVRNRHNISENEIIIKEGTPCEIQIRTLEQHAYAELSHDYVYKQEEKINSYTRRYMARSMALNETTDELFSKVYDMVENEKEKYDKLTDFLRSKTDFANYNEKIDQSIYECVKPMLEKYNINEETVHAFLNDYYMDQIRKRQGNIIYQQPMVIMLYILAKDHAAELQENWCFTQDMLGMVFSDLGINSEDDY